MSDDATTKVLIEMSHQIGRLTGQVESMTTTQTAINTNLTKMVHKQDKRIGSLENTRTMARGALIGSGIFSGGVGAFMMKLFGAGAAAGGHAP